MAINIALTINAETSAELKAALLDLAALYADSDTDIVDATASTDAAPRGRRGRPPKTDAAPATTVSGVPAGTPALGLGASSDSGPTATTAASPSDAGALTLEQVKAKMEAAMNAGTQPLKLQEMLTAAGLPARCSEMSPDQYPKAIEVFDRAIALG